MIRCKWCNLKNEKYIEYHDKEWCKSNFEDKYLFEMLILESFQAGLSWECVLNKREDFRKAFDNFDIDKISNYDEKKIDELMANKNIIRNRLKIKANINEANIAIAIPPADAVNPPVKIPIIPSSLAAMIAPLARLAPKPIIGTVAPAFANSLKGA